ncbi:MAG: ThuA domain-containing protein, partial [Verrucomicrobiota bacterium]|nr:ThuA domain-containing protein [Verrucomicrobiota bacterium]
ILVFFRCEGFIHTSIPHANFALQEMARKSKAFSVDLEDEYEVFNKKNLKQYHAILFNSASELKFTNENQRKAILDFVRGGGGLIGIHGASDNFYEWEEGAEMIGGQFNGHPWTAGGTWAFKVDDPTHPLNQAFGGRGFWHQDEIYQYLPSSYVGPDKLRILVSLDMSKETVREPMEMEKFERSNSKYPSGNREVPVSWVQDIGKGRLFYTNFGHREDTYKNPVIMQHIFDGILFAIGYNKMDTTPTSELPPIAPALAPAKE